jgi:ATP-dependent Clp protease ATP-binding subunit ClpC
VDFRNSIVIMTSNIGASEIAKNTGLGFTVGDETGITYDEMKNRIMGELKKVFRPEFLNRIDEVIVFHKLTKEEIKLIVDLLMKRIRESLAERELSLNLSDEAADLLVEKGWDPAMGARPLRRAIQRYIEDPLADEVLAQNAEPGSTVEVERLSENERAQQAEATDTEVRELKITIAKPARKPVAVGAEGEGEGDKPELEGGDAPSGPEDSPDLPDEPEVLPDVPDAPPAPEGEGEQQS